MVIVYGEEAGISDEQRSKFQFIRAQLGNLLTAARAFITKDPKLINATLDVYALILDQGKGSFVIELSDTDATQIHRVTFHDSKPYAYQRE